MPNTRYYKNYIYLIFFAIASRRPFSITFITDNDEREETVPRPLLPITSPEYLASVAAQTAANNERELSPGGIVGFSLDFRQAACT